MPFGAHVYSSHVISNKNRCMKTCKYRYFDLKRQKWEFFYAALKSIPIVEYACYGNVYATSFIHHFSVFAVLYFMEKESVGVSIIFFVSEGLVLWLFLLFLKHRNTENLHLLLCCRRPRQRWYRHLSGARELLLQMGLQVRNTKWDENCLSITCPSWHADQVQQLVLIEVPRKAYFFILCYSTLIKYFFRSNHTFFFSFSKCFWLSYLENSGSKKDAIFLLW